MTTWKLTIRAQPTYKDGLVRFEMTLDDKSFTLRLAEVDRLVQSIDSAIKGEDDVSYSEYVCIRPGTDFLILRAKQEYIGALLPSQISQFRNDLEDIQKGIRREICGC